MPHKQIGVAQHAAEMLSDAGVQSVRSVARLDRWKSTEIIKPYYRTDTLDRELSASGLDFYHKPVKTRSPKAHCRGQTIAGG